MKRKLLLPALLLLLGSVLLAQTENPKQPYRAMLYSAAFPGGGQFYNGMYLKTGIVIGLQGLLINYAIHDYDKMKSYQKKMNQSTDAFEIALLRKKRDDWRDELRNDYWWMGITLALSMADAFVDAHLYNFNSQKDKIHLQFADKQLQLSYKF